MGEICDLLNKATGCAIGTIEKREISKATYYRIVVSLNKPLDNIKLSIKGEYLTIAKIKGYGSAKLRFNHPNATLLDLREIREFDGHFDEVYFSTDGIGSENLISSDCIIYVATTVNSKIHIGEAYRVEGVPINLKIYSHDYVERFSGYNMIMNEFHIRNTHGVFDLMIGLVPSDTLPSIGDFRDTAFAIVELYTFKLKNINLNRLGFSTSATGHNVWARCMGTPLE